MTRCSLKASQCHYCHTTTKLCQGEEFFEMIWKCPNCGAKYDITGEVHKNQEERYDVIETLKEGLILCLQIKDQSYDL